MATVAFDEAAFFDGPFFASGLLGRGADGLRLDFLDATCLDSAACFSVLRFLAMFIAAAGASTPVFLDADVLLAAAEVLDPAVAAVFSAAARLGADLVLAARDMAEVDTAKGASAKGIA